MTAMVVNFRQIAGECVARAKVELATNDPYRLRYGALELRDAMEALTYDRALAFKEYIPPDEYRTWQPRKLMLVLLDIDPSIGSTSTIAFGLQEELGKPAPRENMKVLGTDVVLTLSDLKKHYDALGSIFAHAFFGSVAVREDPGPGEGSGALRKCSTGARKSIEFATVECGFWQDRHIRRVHE